MSEYLEQKKIIIWCNKNKLTFPELDLIYSIPNEAKRSIKLAKKLKASGLKSGVPDLCLPVRNNKYNNLYIETKFDKNKPTPNQKKWIIKLQKYNNFCVVCYSAKEACKIIYKYINNQL